MTRGLKGRGAQLSWLCRALLCGWVLVSGAARAQTPEVYVVAVSADAHDELAAHEVAALARAALADADGFRFREADAVARGELTAAHDAYAAGLLAFARGRQAYLALDLEVAQAALELACAQFRSAGPVLDSPEPPSQALMYLGAAHVLSGDAAGARSTFERYHAAFGQLAPDARVFNPEVMTAWEQAGRALASRSQGSLVLEGVPASAEVTLDGRVRGIGIRSLEGLAPGEHGLRVSVPGSEPFFSMLMVKPRERTRVLVPALAEQPEFAARLRALAGSAELPASGAQVDELRQALGAQALAVIQVSSLGAEQLALSLSVSGAARPGAAKSERVGAEFGQRSQAVRVLMAEFLDRVAQQAHAVERQADVAVAPMLPPEAPRQDGPRPWYKRAWLWSLVGVLVVGGAATGTALALTRQAKSPGHTSDGGTLTLEF